MFPACAPLFRFLITDRSDHIRPSPNDRRLFRFAALAVADLLKRFGASHVNSYGMFIIEALG